MLETIVQNSHNILLPGGRDYEGCVNVFEKVFGITVPAFPDRRLSIDQDNRRFIKVKSRDVPQLIQQGYGDIGVVYTDVCRENITDESMAYQEIGDGGLKLSLLFPAEKEEEIKMRLHLNNKPLVVATAYPRLLTGWLKEVPKDTRLNISVASLTPSGSVEAMVALGVADAAVDVVNTGATARANNLGILPLLDIKPAVIYKKT